MPLEVCCLADLAYTFANLQTTWTAILLKAGTTTIQLPLTTNERIAWPIGLYEAVPDSHSAVVLSLIQLNGCCLNVG